MQIRSGNTGRLLLAATVAALALAGCAATGEQTGGAQPDGQWSAINQADLAKKLVGNTTEEVTGRWAAHYAKDGRKVVWVNGNETRERTWRIDDKGQWCETLYRDGAERCGPNYQVSGNQIRKVQPHGATDWKATVVAGNPRKL